MDLLCGIYSEIILSIGIILIILGDIFLSSKISKKIISRVAILTLLLSTSSLALNIDFYLKEMFFNNSLIICDYISIIFKCIFLLGGIVTVILSQNSNLLLNRKSGEFYALLLGAILGAMFIASANNLILFYISFEMLSICSYALVGYDSNVHSKEASLKYALFGSISSAFMILGFSYLYGITGTIDISSMIFSVSDMLTLESNVFTIFISLFLVFAGIGFKICAFPFHFWAPDVYEGAPTSISAFLSVVSKAAGISLILRILLIPVGLWYEYFWNGSSLNLYQIIIGLIAVLSMCYGNFIAIKQDNLKRLMGYSSIAHIGYMLLALSTGNKIAINAVIFYMIVYFFMNFVIFSFINFTQKLNGNKEIFMENIHGVGKKFPIIGICVFIALISLSGLPPTGGFSGKFLLFDSIIQRALMYKNAGFATYFFFTLALIGVLNSVISLYYYMRIAKAMFFKEGCNIEVKNNKCFLFDKLIMILLTLPILLLLNFSLADFLYNG